MSFAKFKVVDTNEMESVSGKYFDMIVNLDHIVSIKPINIMVEESLVEGYWMRLTNGKKYKAVDIPAELKNQLPSMSSYNFVNEDDSSSSEELH